MDDSPFISVVVPVYNSELFIRESLDSLLKQTYKNFEVLIVNDGSTDSSLEIIKSHCNNSIFKVISQPNQGLSVARNTGINASKGKIISFLDSDDLYHKDYLLRVADFHKKNPQTEIAAFSRAMYINEESELLYPYSFAYPYHLTLEKFIDCPLLPVTVSLKKAAIEKFGYFNPETRIAEDYEFWIKMASEGVEFLPCPNNLVYYRYRKSGMMYNSMDKYNSHFIELQTRLLEKNLFALKDEARKIRNKRFLTANILNTVNKKSICNNLDLSVLSDSEVAEVSVHGLTRALLTPWEKWIKIEENWITIIETVTSSIYERYSKIVSLIKSYDAALKNNQLQKIRSSITSALDIDSEVGVFGAGRQSLKLLPAFKGLEDKIIFIDDCPVSHLKNFRVRFLKDCTKIKTIFLSSPNYTKSIKARILSERAEMKVLPLL